VLGAEGRSRQNAGLHAPEVERRRGPRHQGTIALGWRPVAAAAAWADNGGEGRGRCGTEDADGAKAGGGLATRLQAVVVPRLGPARARLSSRTVAGRRAATVRRATA
jgi:hypothetical protein